MSTVTTLRCDGCGREVEWPREGMPDEQARQWHTGHVADRLGTPVHILDACPHCEVTVRPKKAPA